MLDIIYQDEYLIAINKPHGLLVHRTAMASDAKVFALQLLRDQVGRKVIPAARLQSLFFSYQIGRASCRERV